MHQHTNESKRCPKFKDNRSGATPATNENERVQTSAPEQHTLYSVKSCSRINDTNKQGNDSRPNIYVTKDDGELCANDKVINVHVNKDITIESTAVLVRQ